MSERVINFYAGPAGLPLPALERAQKELVNFAGTGMSVMEMSHRSKAYEEIIFGAEQVLRDIMEIPSYVRGAYFVSSDEKGKIDFYVLDPKNKTIQVRLDKREGLFYFNATKKGVYSFIFWSNKVLFDYFPFFYYF